MKAKILATRQTDRHTLAVLAGDGIERAAIGDVYRVPPGGEDLARLRLCSTGHFPVAEVTYLHPAILPGSLIGEEVERIAW